MTTTPPPRSAQPTNSAAPPDTQGRQYVLGVNDAEVARLGFQHRVWSAAAHALWERAGLHRGMRVLDVGCGPGYATVDLAHLVGGAGRVVGVDEAPMYLESLRHRCAAEGLAHVDAVLGDIQALETLGLGAAPFDFAYARWALCFTARPERVVEGVGALLRRGGVFAAQDYFNYESITLAPRSAVFDKIIEAVARSWRTRGGDPDVVARLPAALRANGFDVVEITPNLRAARPGTMLWGWPDTFFRYFALQLERMGEITRDLREEFEREWAERSNDPTTFLATPPVYDVIAVKR